MPASPTAGQGRQRESRAGPEPTSSRYPRPQCRGGRAGGKKWPRPNSLRPPEKPTTPPVSLSPAAPGRPPRSSARAPAGFQSAPRGLGRDVGASGSEWGCARQAGRPPLCHPSVPCPRGALPSSAILRQARRPQAEVRTRAPGHGRPPTHPLASSRAGPPRQRESWRRRTRGLRRWGQGAGVGESGLGRGDPHTAAAGPASSSVVAATVAQRRPLLPLLLLPLLPRGDSCCCCCCIAARCARLRRVSCSPRVEIAKKKKAPPSPAPGSRGRAARSPLLLATAAVLLRLRLPGTRGCRGGGGSGAEPVGVACAGRGVPAAAALGPPPHRPLGWDPAQRKDTPHPRRFG